MTETEFVTVTITGPSTEELTMIVRALVDARLAACGNIIPSVTSIYRWQGSVAQESETLAVVHTRANLFARLEAMVTELHPYDVPLLVSLPATTTHPYGAWLNESIVAE